MRAYKVLMIILIVALLLGMALGCGKKKVPDTGKAGPEGAEPRAEGIVPGGGAGPPMPGGPGGGEGPPMPGIGERPAPAGAAAELVEEGMAEKRAGRFDQAVVKFEAALLEDPDNEDAHWGLAWTLADQGKKSQAIAEFEEGLELTVDPGRTSEAEAAIERLQ